MKIACGDSELKVELNFALHEPLCPEEPVETWPMAINIKEGKGIQ